MNEYKNDLLDYCRRRIFECPKRAFTNPQSTGFIPLGLRVNEDFGEYSLNNIKELQASITETLGLSKYTLQLCDVTDGCVTVVFRIPSWLGDVITISSEQQQKLVHIGVKMLLVGTCTKFDVGLSQKQQQVIELIEEPTESVAMKGKDCVAIARKAVKEINQGNAEYASMALSLVAKGKDCVAVGRKTVKEINQGNVKDASIKLDGLKMHGTELAEQAEDLAKRLEKVQEYNQNMEEETQRKIGEYGRREQDLQKQMDGIQANLDSQRRILEDKHSRLVQARNTLSDAERKRHEKEAT